MLQYTSLKLSLRYALNNKLFSAINIGGLSIGIASFILVSIMVEDELSYDRWITDVDQIYKLEQTFTRVGRAPNPFAITQMPAAPALLQDYAEDIDVAIRIRVEDVTVHLGEVQIEEEIYFAEKGFFTLFDIPLIKGHRDLENINSILLSEEMAKKYLESWIRLEKHYYLIVIEFIES